MFREDTDDSNAILEKIDHELTRSLTGEDRLKWLMPSTKSEFEKREENFKILSEGRSNFMMGDLYRPDLGTTAQTMIGTNPTGKDDFIPKMPIFYTEHNKWEWEKEYGSH